MRSFANWAVAVMAVSGAQTALAAELTVTVTGAENDDGEIACGLYMSEDGFPMDPSKATQKRRAPVDGEAVFVFSELPAGVYALAAAHDENTNGKTDTNFLGVPKETWGVSNNVRPRLRAPFFEEAQFEIVGDQPVALTIELD